LDQKLGHSVSNWKSKRFMFQLLESKLDMQELMNVNVKMLFLFKRSHNRSQLCYPPDIELNNGAIFWHTSLISSEHEMILVFILIYKLCHIPLKDRRLITKNDHIRHISFIRTMLFNKFEAVAINVRTRVKPPIPDRVPIGNLEGAIILIKLGLISVIKFVGG